MIPLRKIRRTYYLFRGSTRFRLRFRGRRMDIYANKRPVPDDDLHEFVQWIISCTDEVRSEAGLLVQKPDP